MPVPFTTSLRALAAGAALLILSACGDGTGPDVRVPTTATLAGTVGTTGTVGAAVTGAPAVLVKDAKGKPLAGAQVTFEVTAGNGSVAQPSAATDAAGVASAGSWTLGTRPGTNTVVARVGTLPPVTFSAEAAVDQATSITPDSANPTSVGAGQVLSPAPAVRVKDRFGNGVPGVLVTFSAGAGNGSLSGLVSMATDAAGLARPERWTVGGAMGTQTLTAAAGALSTTVSISVRAGAAASMTAVAGGSQTGTVGAPLTVRPAVRLRDAYGNNVTGAMVAFAVTGGGGSVTGAAATTGADGIATVGDWLLGTAAGTNTLSATSPGVTAVLFTATGRAAAPAKIEKVEGDAQSVNAGATLPVSPTVRVRDAYDNPVSGVTVTFTATAGSVTGGNAVTDAGGLARATWKLGSAAGAQSLEARIGTFTTTFSATALPGSPARLEIAAGNGQSAVAGTLVGVRPAVRVLDAGSNPVQGVPVTFAAAAGSGTVNGATVLSGADGVATVGGWTLGTIAGAKTLTASSAGLTAVTFTATALTGPAARLAKSAGDGQSVAAGSAVAVRPTVRVTDANDNPVSGVTVTFAVAGGGGSITGATQVTAATGLASVGSWTLGAAEGVNTLTVTAPGVGNLTFTANGMNPNPSSDFDIELRYLGPISAAHQQVFQNAVARWESIIIGDLPPTSVNAAAGACGANPGGSETIDDLVIYVAVDSIDGVGQVLGQAGPCYIRNSSSLPVMGHMRFDRDDLDRMATNGTLNDVILHEMGHVLGIGTLWTYHSLLQGAGTSDPYFSGQKGGSQFTLAGGTIPVGNGIPVENTGNSGTRDSHWRETTMRNELMTGWISTGANPLSAITIGSLEDMGYRVNYLAATAFTVPAGVLGSALVDRGIELVELPMPAPRIAY